ncbi:MAG: DUF2752 domain-containing protein [Clostridiales bacterium]|nr:DUF2752 domain-containing protein [Clostridiales bacterium]
MIAKPIKKMTVEDDCFYIVGWIFLALSVAALLLARFGVFEQLGLANHQCALHRLTGYYCPGCGGTRAVIALLHGHIFQSLYYHPLVVYVLAVGGWYMVSQTVERLSRGRAPIALRYKNAYLWLALALTLINCVVKNLVLAILGVALL